MTQHVPPWASVTFVDGVRLVRTGTAPGRLEVAPAASAPGFAVVADGYTVRAFFREETDLGEGITARAGAIATVRVALDDGRFEVNTVEDNPRPVPCRALASSRPTPPGPWKPFSPRQIHQVTDLVTDGGTTLRKLFDGTVDLYEIDGDRALVRIDIDGYLLTGWIDASALQPHDDWVPDEYGIGGFGYGLSGTGPTTPCTGPAVLRAGSPIMTGPRTDQGARLLASLDHDLDVQLIAALGDDRQVEMTTPAPGVARATAWVAVTDLDSARCEP